MFRKKTPTPPTTPTEYPVGSFLETEKGLFYVAAPGKRYRVTSHRVLASWSPPRLIKTTEAAVVKFRIAAKMKFRNGSLIWSLGDGKIYLVENGKRRWLKNPEWFYHLGLDPTDLAFNMKKIQMVSHDEINLHEAGEDLD